MSTLSYRAMPEYRREHPSLRCRVGAGWSTRGWCVSRSSQRFSRGETYLDHGQGCDTTVWYPDVV